LHSQSWQKIILSVLYSFAVFDGPLLVMFT
jgi:hypothetical protein